MSFSAARLVRFGVTAHLGRVAILLASRQDVEDSRFSMENQSGKVAYESAARLGRKAAEAEASRIAIHGVSVTAGRAEGAVSRATRETVEGSFRVHNTPTRADPLHRTVELPKPVTREVADLVNRILGRSR